VDKAKADDQRHAGERQHHYLQVRKAIGGKQRKIVHDKQLGLMHPGIGLNFGIRAKTILA
jgi:hypothetical protein